MRKRIFVNVFCPLFEFINVAFSFNNDFTSLARRKQWLIGSERQWGTISEEKVQTKKKEEKVSGRLRLALHLNLKL